MSRIINGSLTVPSYDQTGNAGEYTITGATFFNATDATGNGAFDIQVGFVLYVPAMDVNTATPATGVVHRYRITSLTVVDAATIDCTVLWDEGGDEEDAPLSGVAALITEVTPNYQYGFVVDVNMYPELVPYIIPSALNNDVKNIDDQVSSGGTVSYVHNQTESSAAWIVVHNRNSVNFTYTIYDVSGAQVWPDSITVTNANTVQINFLAAMQGKAIFMFV